MDNKKAAWTIAVCGALTAGLLAAPKLFEEEPPRAAVVNVSKIEYSDSVSAAGTVFKNRIDGTAYVQTFISEQDISGVKTGQTAEITGSAFPDKVYAGRVEEISDTAVKVQAGNLQQTAVEVKIAIDEGGEELKQGYTANVKLITSEPGIMTVVPYEAVNQDGGGEFVYILREGRAYKRYVETGRELSEGLELRTAIGENEEIITVDELSGNGVSVKLAGE